MPSLKSAKSSQWFLRVDGELEHLRPKVVKLAENIDLIDLLATHHTGERKENPHTHMVITFRGEVQKQSMAIRLKKHFEVVDRSYALDVWDGRRAEYGAVSYLFHEKDAPIICQKGWALDEIQTACKIAADANAVIAKAKDKASTKFVDRALEHFQGWTECPSNQHIFKFMVDEVAASRLYWPGANRAKQMVEEVQIKLTPNLPGLIDEMYRNIFRY